MFCEIRFAAVSFALNESCAASEAIKQTTRAIQLLHVSELVFEIILLVVFRASDKRLIEPVRDFVMRSLLYDSFESFSKLQCFVVVRNVCMYLVYV